MELESIILQRRSTKGYRETTLERARILGLIEMGINAPSACNIQGWRFIIVDDPSTKQWFVEAGAPLFVGQASAGVLVLYDNRTANREYQDHIQSAAACIQNILLAATDQGIDSCWVCRLPAQDKIRENFQIDGHYDVIAYIALGFRDRQPAAKPRKVALADLVSYNVFTRSPAGYDVKRRFYLAIPQPVRLLYRFFKEGRFSRKKK
jgi:nitroreductase